MNTLLRNMVLALVLLGLLSAPAEAGLKKYGNSGFVFLKVGQSARSAAMGDASTAVVVGVEAIFTNSAGLAYVEKPSFTVSHNRWLVDSKFYSAALAYPLGRHVLGISMITFQLPEYEETTIYQPSGTGTIIRDNDLAIGLTYAIQFTDRFTFGAQARYVQETLFQDSHSSVDLSVGTHFYTGFRSLRLAMALRNFGTDIEIIDDKAFMPLIYSIAGAMEVYGKVGDPTYLTVSAENAFFIDYERRINTGAELWLGNAIALRGGYKFNSDTESITLGAGIKKEFADQRAVTVDFSYGDMGDLLDPVYRISLGGAF
jgi:hypothetical protein